MLISIYNDGKNFTPSESDGMGLKNMKQRTKILGGIISWNGVASNEGTTVDIILPIKLN